jgi:hypothetical protein
MNKKTRNSETFLSHRAYVIHHIPGRMRLKLPHAKGNPAWLQRIKESISPQPGIKHVEINPTTGSVLIQYDPEGPDNFNKRLAQYAEHEKLFALEVTSQEPEDESSTARAIADLFNRLNQVTKRKTNDAIDLRDLFPLGTAIYAFFWVDRSIGAPLWLSMLFFSWSAYMDLHETEPSQKVAETLEALRAEIAALRADIRNRELPSKSSSN